MRFPGERLEKENLHEASSSGDHDVLDIGEGFKLGGAGQERGILPNTKVLKELPATGMATSCADEEVRLAKGVHGD